MQQYAINEIRDLLNRLTSPIQDRDPIGIRRLRHRTSGERAGQNRR
jgi:hypothetical protein